MSVATQVARHALLTRPQRHRVAPHRDGVAELLLPRGPVPAAGHPVAVVLHGGYWRTRYGAIITRPVCADLRSRGWATWNVEYGRLGPRGRGGWPQTFDDVATAIDHLAGLRDTPLDLDRVVAIGHSAGGQLALWAGGRAGLPAGTPGADPLVRVRHVVALAPVTSMVRAGARAQELLGGAPQDVPERFALADPVRRVPLGVPVTVVHPADDDVVPPVRSREYVEGARSAGAADVELLEPAGGHSDVIDPGHAAWHAAREVLERLASGAARGATAVP